MKRFFYAMGMFAVALLVSSVAQAQTAAEPVAFPFWRAMLTEVLAPVISLVLTGAVLFGIQKFSQLTGINIEAKHQATLHSAAQTGLNLVLAKYGAPLNVLGSKSAEEAVVRGAVQYIASTGAPDAVKALKLTEDQLKEIVASKLGAMQSASATLAVTSTGGANSGT